MGLGGQRGRNEGPRRQWCVYAGWLSQWGQGAGGVRPVVGVRGFGFRAYRSVWLVVHGDM